MIQRVLVAAALLACGCVGDLKTRSCSGDSECLQGGVGGSCVASPSSAQKYCVFPSARCAGGEWGILSGDGLASTCHDPGAGVPDGGTRTDAQTGEANLEIAPRTLQLGSVVVGREGLDIRLLVSSTGSADSGELSISIEDDRDDIRVVGDLCSGRKLSRGGTCAIDLRFRPTATGQRQGTLVVSATPGGPAVASLVGQGLAEGPLNVQPPTYEYPATVEGTPGTEASFDVRNTSENEIGPLAVALASGADFAVTDSGCAGTLAGLGTCAVRVRFAPAATGVRRDSLVVSLSGGGAAAAQISGEGRAAALLAIQPDEHDFGALSIGGLPVTMDFTIRNEGGTTSGVPVVMSSDPAAFAIVNDGCTATLAPQATCEVRVAFHAVEPEGMKSGTLTATASPGGVATATLGGRALGIDALAIAPQGESYGDVAVGAASPTRDYRITNNGAVPTGPLTVALTGNDPTSFEIAANDCPAMLAAEASCTVKVAFRPAAVGSKSATLGASADPGGAVAASLAGSGAATLTVVKAGDGAGTVTSAPAGIDCGATCGASFSAATVTLTATPDASSELSSWSGGGCSGSGECVVALAGATTVTATFARRTATLAVDPTDRYFGAVTLGRTSTVETFEVRNDGGAASGALNVTLSETDSWSVTGGTCGSQSLAAGATCTVLVRFEPSGAAGPKSSSLTITATPGGSATATLTGSALTVGVLELSTESHDFLNVARGSSSSTLSVQVTNGGQSATENLSVTLSDTTNFSIVSNDCPTTLGAAAMCTVGVRFNPASVGLKQGVTLTLAASPGGQAVTALRGTGTAQVTVTNAGGGTVSSAPTGISCGTTCSATFSSEPVTLTATPSGGFTFGGWSGACTGTSTCVLPLDAATKSVTASFASVPVADVSLSASDNPDPVLHGGDITYTYTVRNNGPQGATGVTLTSTLAASATYVSASSTVGSCTRNLQVVTCPIGALGNGLTATVTVKATATATGSVVNPASVTANEDDPVTTNNSTSVTTTVSAAADLDVDLTDAPDPVALQADLTYTLTVRNNGPDTASNVRAVLGVSSSVNTVSYPMPACTLVNTTFTCQASSLASGASQTYPIVVRPAAAGTLPASATVTSDTADPSSTNNSDSASTVASGTPVTVTVNASGGRVTSSPGGIDCTTNGCTAMFPSGSTVTLTARGNNSTTRFAGWSGECSGGASKIRECAITLTGTTARTATASFVTYSQNLAFVSSTKLAGVPAGGVPGGFDAECNTLATAAGINNPSGDAYVSWMPSGAASAPSRLSSGGVIRVDGSPFAQSLTDLTSGKILNPLNLDESGRTVNSGDSDVWTGTNANGTVAQSCASSSSGTTGFAWGGPVRWSQSSTASCATSTRRVYCFMKTMTAALTITPATGKRIYTVPMPSPRGGIAAADAACESTKPAGTGSVKALLPLASSTPARAAAALIVSGTTYVRPDGIPVGTGSDLRNASNIQAGPWQNGAGVYGEYLMFTGPPVMVAPSSPAQTCSDWTVTTGNSNVGTSSLASILWWSDGTAACSEARHIYCVEQ